MAKLNPRDGISYCRFEAACKMTPNSRSAPSRQIEGLMSKAKKLAHLRLVLAALVFAPGIVLPLVFDLEAATRGWPDWALAVAIGAYVLTSGAACLYFGLFWHPRCPQCRKVGARLTRVGDDEYLVCGTCDYREKTGYEFGG